MCNIVTTLQLSIQINMFSVAVNVVVTLQNLMKFAFVVTWQLMLRFVSM